MEESQAPSSHMSACHTMASQDFPVRIRTSTSETGRFAVAMASYASDRSNVSVITIKRRAKSQAQLSFFCSY